MTENKIRQLAKKILHVRSFQELHDIIMEYASDEREFVEFPDSLDKFSPKGFKKTVREIEEGKHKKSILDDFWPEKFPDKTSNKDQEIFKKYRDMMNGNPDR